MSVPWIDPERDHERDPEAESTLADVYRGSLDRNVRRVAAVVRAFLDAPSGPVVLHCAAGKDRTGMAVARLLETAGVPREHVVADYALSEEALGIPAVLADHPGPPEARAHAEEHWRTRPSTMAAALAISTRRTAGGGLPARALRAHRRRGRGSAGPAHQAVDLRRPVRASRPARSAGAAA